MSKDNDNGWTDGVRWAVENWYDSRVGKNVDGGKLGRVLGSYGRLFPEGVRWALGNPEKALIIYNS